MSSHEITKLEDVTIGDTWYRAISAHNPTTYYFEEWSVVSKTDRGVWISPWQGSKKKKFILFYAHKRYAWPTKEEAIVSFIARKRRQVALLEGQLSMAKEQLALATDAEYARLTGLDLFDV